MKILLNEDACTGCKTCVKVCPQMILEVVDEKMRVKDESRCMGCFGCEDECRFGAVRLLRAPQSQTDVEIESAPDHGSECDVAVVGAGPAGLGAAIACAKAGLDVVVFERLPNRKLSHHTDGGVLFPLPDVTSVECSQDTISFPGLGLSINASFARKCGSLGLLGPAGLRTKNDIPANVDVWAGNKDGFVEALVDAAEATGAMVRFNAKVVDVLRDEDRVAGLQLDTGEAIRAKVVVTADGVQAKISEKAGMQITHDDMWYGSVLAFEYDNTDDLPGGLYYLNGDMRFEDGMPQAFGGVGITDVIHVLVAWFSRKKFHPAPKPMDHYVRLLLENDPRVREILGDSLRAREPKMLTGCRAVMRGAPNRDTAAAGVVSVGDAWVDDGEIGNVPALANGVHAGRTIAEAAQKGDFSQAALGPANEFLTDGLFGMLSENKKAKLLPVRFSEEELKQMFGFMQHMNYPVLMFGTPKQRNMMFAGFTLKNAFRMLRYPKIAKALF